MCKRVACIVLMNRGEMDLQSHLLLGFNMRPIEAPIRHDLNPSGNFCFSVVLYTVQRVLLVQESELAVGVQRTRRIVQYCVA